MRHGWQPVMPLAKVYRLGRDHDPDGLIRKDHSTFLSAATKAAARSGLQSGATCKTAPQISTRITPVPPTAAAAVSEIDGSITGLAPVAHDSGTLRGKRAIAGCRRALLHVMFQAALVAAHHNPSLKSFADRLRKAGKSHKVIITAVARKLVTIANALFKSRQKWTAATA
jgi:transposase